MNLLITCIFWMLVISPVLFLIYLLIPSKNKWTRTPFVEKQDVAETEFVENVSGRRGEERIEQELHTLQAHGRDGKILRNVYIPKIDGSTSELDVVFVTSKGIFVIESKDYSGWIYGDEKQEKWTQTLSKKEKNHFYNPILQNKSHTKCLDQFLGHAAPIFSIVVFSERCELKEVTYTDPAVEVVKLENMCQTICNIWDWYPDLLSREQVDAIAAKLEVCTYVSDQVKHEHIYNIKKQYPNE